MKRRQALYLFRILAHIVRKHEHGTDALPMAGPSPVTQIHNRYACCDISNDGAPSVEDNTGGGRRQ